MFYAYQAVTRSSQLITDRQEAPSAQALRERLARDGLQVVEVQLDVRATLLAMFQPREVSRASLIDLFSYLSNLLDLGININQALHTVRESADDKVLIATLGRVIDGVEKGYSLHQAMESAGMFPPLVIASIAAAERSNRLQAVFGELTRHYRDTDELIQNAKKAATYPIIALTVLLGVLVMMLLMVVPQLRDIIPANPPLPTRVLFFLSDSLGYSWWLLPFVVVGLWVGWNRLGPEKKGYIWQLLYRVPAVGRLALNLELSRVFMNLSMLNGGGIPVLDTFPIVIGTTTSSYVAERLRLCHKLASQGGKLSEGFRDPVFPPIVARAVIHGEATGKFDKQFSGVSVFLRDRVKNQVHFLSTFIEPVLMLVGGGLMLLMALAIFLPLYGQMNKIGR